MVEPFRCRTLDLANSDPVSQLVTHKICGNLFSKGSLTPPHRCSSAWDRASAYFWHTVRIKFLFCYMAHKLNKDVSDIAIEGPGLVFIVYPEAIATMPAPSFWSVMFFLMLLTLGLDSSFGGSEAIITALSDEYELIRKNREIFVACLFSFYFLVGLTTCTEGGVYIFQLLDSYAAGYVYPKWANVIGWCIAFSSMSCIPIMACYQMAKASGSFTEALHNAGEPLKILYAGQFGL
ncbi:hypothetical protein L1887_52904 [Cichorium endivia]|nr:hypothetical protein L1887_52904 [Cichorium endivia]